VTLTLGLAIPAYRNAEGLARALESVRRVAPSLLARAIVVDDSGDGRVAAAIAPRFPDVSWRVHAVNEGFGPSATEAVAANPADVVVLLNDDVEIAVDPESALREEFADPDVFAVTFRSLDARGRFREGAKRLAWPMGLPRVLHNEKDQRPARDGRRTSDYAVGGHAAFRRRDFERLGGFDPLFEPFYWEDVDLALRARTAGGRIVYRADVVVRHAGESAIRAHHEAERIRAITLRNRFLVARRHGAQRTAPLRAIADRWYALCDPVARRALAEARHRWRTAGGAGPGQPAASISRAARTTDSTEGPPGA
jgi:GT2 family glycosyltransferase